MHAWVFASRSTGPSSRAISSWTTRTKRAWGILVRAEPEMTLLLYFLLNTFCFWVVLRAGCALAFSAKLTLIFFTFTNVTECILCHSFLWFRTSKEKKEVMTYCFNFYVTRFNLQPVILYNPFFGSLKLCIQLWTFNYIYGSIGRINIFLILQMSWNMSFVCLKSWITPLSFFSFHLLATKKKTLWITVNSSLELSNQNWVGNISQHTSCKIQSRQSLCICRNCGPARTGRFWPGVQPVEEQGVRVPQLQQKHRCLSLCAAPGEVSRNGTQQQSHRQPQVKPLSRPHRVGIGNSHSCQFSFFFLANIILAVFLYVQCWTNAECGPCLFPLLQDSDWQQH